jgi:hypothetical protein
VVYATGWMGVAMKKKSPIVVIIILIALICAGLFLSLKDFSFALTLYLVIEITAYVVRKVVNRKGESESLNLSISQSLNLSISQSLNL